MKYSLFFLLVLLLSASCSTIKTTTYWVSGVRPKCPPNEGKTNCLTISQGENLETANWETVDFPISGFVFEEGYLQKIEVIEKMEFPKNSTIKIGTKTYTLNKTVEKREDARALLSGTWLPNKIYDQPISDNEIQPELTINISEMKVTGTDGCNNYFGPIEQLTLLKFKMGMLAGTKKMCQDMEVPDKFNTALSEVETYKVQDDNLSFRNTLGIEVLSFFKKKTDKKTVNTTDHWIAIRVNGNSIETNNRTPTMNIDLSEAEISGTDGCNNYNAHIDKISDGIIKLSTIRTTKKMCPDMEIPTQFQNALQQASRYKMSNKLLQLFNNSGKELVAFMKVD